MTKEPIMIDDVDVAECENLYTTNLPIGNDKIKCGLHQGIGKTCNDYPNCHYKLYKRKEQECERLKHDNGYEVGALEKTIDNLKAENDELKTEFDKFEEQIKLQGNFIDSFLFATKNSDWLNKSILEDEAAAIIEKVESDYVQLEKYKQALQEIREVVELAMEEVLTIGQRNATAKILEILQKCEVLKDEKV